MSAIENDTAAVLAYLRAQVPSPSTVASMDIQRYQAAWLRYGYGAPQYIAVCQKCSYIPTLGRYIDGNKPKKKVSA